MRLWPTLPEEPVPQQKGDCSLARDLVFPARDFVSPAKGFDAAGQIGGPGGPFLGTYCKCFGRVGFSLNQRLSEFQSVGQGLGCYPYHQYCHKGFQSRIEGLAGVTLTWPVDDVSLKNDKSKLCVKSSNVSRHKFLSWRLSCRILSFYLHHNVGLPVFTVLSFTKQGH